MNESCVCVYDSADGDSPTFFHDGVRRARKAYTCIECRDTIAIGERYHYACGKWADGVRTYHTCLPCDDIRRNFFCEGWTYGSMWEDIEEQVFNEQTLTGACLEQLGTVDAKQQLAKRWWAWVNDR